MIFNRVEKSNKSRSESSVTSPKPTPAGRERLQHFEIEISKAHEAVEDLQQRVARLAAIDGASNDAERALQNAINADGGRALAAHSNGQTKPGDEIARLIAAAKVSSESAAATKTALPYAESLLENARQQLASLIDQRAAEVTRVIATLADADVRAYEQSWQETCEWHDRLVGFASVANTTRVKSTSWRSHPGLHGSARLEIQPPSLS
jgi:hypothetical protein